MRSIIWFREDFRIQDNTALFQAAEESYEGIVGLYIIDLDLWKNNHTAHCRIEFILRGLAVLSESLAKLSIPLLIRTVNKTTDVPEIILAVVEQVKAQGIFFNKQYEARESERDQAVVVLLEKHHIKSYSYHDQTIITPRDEHSKTFASYKKVWMKQFIQQGGVRLHAKIHEQKHIEVMADNIPTELPGIQSGIHPKLWTAGEDVALKKMHLFIEKILPEYDKIRDFPVLDGTSKLSPYLAMGMISPRLCFLGALEANDNRLGDGLFGALAWMNEFIWRDFYKHIVYTVPGISHHKAYQPKTEKVVWDFNQEQFDAWKEGKTGFPIIDAAMRQLNTTGWMHNRLRIITATFFTKYMFFDWRLGEQYFMEHLMDGDFAANNGGWQWCASTGADTAAYFRFFDPLRQSDRYDPEGKFIKRYCPELLEFSDNYAVHLPHVRAPAQAEKTNYPRPILDLKESRARAIAGFREGVKK